MANKKATNLWEYYSQRGQRLPSVQERREQFGLGPEYRGTAQQNIGLLGQLQQPGRVAGRTTQQPAQRTAPQVSSYVRQGGQAPRGGFGALMEQPQNQQMALIQKYFPREEWQNAYEVMMHESGGNPTIPSQFNKLGTEDSWGLFQINLQAHPQMRDKVLDPEENVKYAGQLWEDQGWSPWFNTAKKLGLPLQKPEVVEPQKLSYTPEVGRRVLKN